MVKTGPGKSSEEVEEAIRSVLKHQEKNFNTIFRELKQRGVMGSPNTLAKYLRAMEKQVYVRTEPGPGIDRKYYGLIEDLPARHDIEVDYSHVEDNLKRFWLMNPRLAPIGITPSGHVTFHMIARDQREHLMPKLERHITRLDEMWSPLLQDRIALPRDRVKEIIRAYQTLWTVVVDAQFQDFTTAMREGREPDYLSAVIKQLDRNDPLRVNTG